MSEKTEAAENYGRPLIMEHVCNGCPNEFDDVMRCHLISMMRWYDDVVCTKKFDMHLRKYCRIKECTVDLVWVKVI